uniref:ATP-dependent helicase ATRX n=1 Tax=Rhipicephalus appendiculatus TaxID=34631 RepID=A0A131YIB9_RHIAP
MANVSSSKAAEEHCSAAVEPDVPVPVSMSPENSVVWRPPTTVEEITNLCVRCTSCGAQVNHHRKSKFRQHKLLNVIVCKRCYQYYGDGHFRQPGSDSDEYCSWCAEGGILVLCDRCGRAFCKECISRNLSCQELNRIESLDEWQCFVCDPAPLEPMVNYASVITNYSRHLKKQRPSSTRSKKPKLSETDMRNVVLNMAREIKHSLSELARRPEGFLAEASKLLRDHASALCSAAENVETCQRRQLRSVKRANRKKHGKNSYQDALPSVGSQPGAIATTGNERLISVGGEQHIGGSDRDNCKDKQVQGRSELCSQDKTSGTGVNPTTEILYASASKREVNSPEAIPWPELSDESAIKTEIDIAEVSRITEMLNVSEIKTEPGIDGCSVHSAEGNGDSAPCGTLNGPLTVNSGGEQSSVAADIKCEDVSENLMTGLPMGSSTEHCSIPSKNDGETAPTEVEVENIEENPPSGNVSSFVDELSSSSSSDSDFDAGEKSSAFEFELVRQVKGGRKLPSSSEDDSSTTSESSETIEEWEQKPRRATRRQKEANSKKGRSRVGRSARAKRSRMSSWLESESSDSSSDTSDCLVDDDEWRDSSRSKSRAPKRKAPTKKKCASPAPPPLSEEVLKRYLEEAFERYQDPKLTMCVTVDVERLEVDHSLYAPPKRMTYETDEWSGAEELEDSSNTAKTRLYDSSNDGDDGEVDVSPTKSQDGDGKGRRNIRRLISDEELAQQTKAAAQAEEERKRRIAERRKLYYEILGTEVGDTHETTTELVLEMDLQTKEPLVQVNEKLVKFMKPHQVKGVKFIYDCVIESLDMLKKDPEKGSGCILAHCMGLGKSFQVISFLHAMMTHKEAGPLLSTALVICPYNTVYNWANEFDQWLHRNGLDMKVYEVSSMKVNIQRLEVLERWHKEGGVAIIGYSLFCHLIKGSGKRKKTALLSRYRKILLNPGPRLVICDEGHVLKNANTGLSKALSTLKTGRRIVLTGTPLQNNLTEYHCMVSFIKPGLLGTKTEFINRFVNPIGNGQCADSTNQDVQLMKKRVHILHRLLEGFVQRCDKTALAPYLPPKHEYVILVRLSDIQVSLYRHFLEHLTVGANDQRMNNISLFTDYFTLQNISTHPLLLELNDDRVSARDFLNDDDEEESDSAIPFIDDVASEKSTPNATDEDVDAADTGEPAALLKEGCEKDDMDGGSGAVKSTSLYHTRSRGDVDNRPPTPQEQRKKQWWDEFVSEEEIEKLQISGKLTLFYDILQECDAIGDKVILFSQSLLTLDMVEKMLEQCNGQIATGEAETDVADPADPMKDCHNTWVLGVDYFRIDGATSVDLRSRWISMFNDENNHRGRLFLVSTRAGSLGTNLVGANRVVLMDASWNPTHDTQAIFRVYRFGQKKPVFIYRLLAQGTMEEKIYNRQVTKLALACRVVDKRHVGRLFNAAELVDLYTFNPVGKDEPQSTPKVPSDRLLAELLIRNKDWIVSYHEHDSLLQNVKTEELTEEEHKLAWEEYKNERDGLIIASTPTDSTLTPVPATVAKKARPTSLRGLPRDGKKAKKRRPAPKVIRIPIYVTMGTGAAASATSTPMFVNSTMGGVTMTTTGGMNVATQNFAGTNMTNVLMAPRVVQVPMQVAVNTVPATSTAAASPATTSTTAVASPTVPTNVVMMTPRYIDTRTMTAYATPTVVQVPVTVPFNNLAGGAPVQGGTQAVILPSGVATGTNLQFAAPRRVLQVQVPVNPNTTAALRRVLQARAPVSTYTTAAPRRVLQVQVPMPTNTTTAPKRVVQVQVPVPTNTTTAAAATATAVSTAVSTSTSTVPVPTASASTSAAATSTATTNLQTMGHDVNDSNNTSAPAALKVVQVPTTGNSTTATEATPEAQTSLPDRPFAFHYIAHKFLNLGTSSKVENSLPPLSVVAASAAGSLSTTIKVNQHQPVYKSTGTSTDSLEEAEPAPVPVVQGVEQAPVKVVQEAEPTPVPLVLAAVPGGLSTVGSKDDFRLVLDIYKMSAEIKSKFPLVTNSQLVFRIKRAMLEYHQMFQRQQCSTIEEKNTFINAQLPIPEEIHVKLKEAGLAIDQLNIALRELDEITKQLQRNQKLNRLVQVLPLLRQRLRHILPRQQRAKDRCPEQVQVVQVLPQQSKLKEVLLQGKDPQAPQQDQQQ